MKRPTIKDVAREAGVSISAVSRAFSDGSIAKDKRARILQVASEIGYHPSTAAQSLKGAQTHTVTLVTGRMHDPFDSSFLEQFAEALADTGRRLIVAPASRQKAEAGGMYQAIADRSDVVVVAAGTMPLDASKACAQVGLPVILAGRFMDLPGVDSVLADNVQGGEQAATLFERSGCTRMAYFGYDGFSFSNEERFQGFSTWLHRKDLSCTRFSVAGREDEQVFEAASAMLASRDRPDAVFCGTDRLAFGVIEAARALRLDIPKELSIIGFNNVKAAARRTYQLSTFNYPVEAVVAEIMDILEARLANPDAAPIHRRIPVSLIVRGTTL